MCTLNSKMKHLSNKYEDSYEEIRVVSDYIDYDVNIMFFSFSDNSLIDYETIISFKYFEMERLEDFLRQLNKLNFTIEPSIDTSDSKTVFLKY